ncbi:MAG: DUF817 family protein [Fimbriimonadaceae bacterium]|nr:DUF817 family protein [Fimbriimonadaceae bacterium]
MREFGLFVCRQMQCAQFAIFIILAGAVVPYLPLGRYDSLLILCLSYQLWMIVSKQETGKELVALCGFHLIGMGLEFYKVRHGSWQYPWPSLLKFADVPIFSGFMYAAVASYMLQAWKRLSLGFSGWPPKWTVILIGCAIYANFFLNRMFADQRWIIGAVALLLFWSTRVEFTVTRRWSISFPIAMFLIGSFIYIAENLCTFLGIYRYPDQASTWSWVGAGKLSSWILLATISVLLVASAKRETVTKKVIGQATRNERLGPCIPLAESASASVSSK